MPSSKKPEQKSTCWLVNFYDPAVGDCDPYDCTLDEILSWPDTSLERFHDYIQTLFPLPEPSRFAYDAPILDEVVVRRFVESRDLKLNVLRALKRMLSFYGFDAEDRGKEREEGEEEEGSSGRSNSSNSDNSFRLIIKPKVDPRPGFAHWLTPVNHNHLRITRILRSLRILGLGGAARDFYNALIKVQTVRGRVGTTTLSFWKRAINSPLEDAPDGTKVPWLASF